MRKIILTFVVLGLFGCAAPPKRETYDLINAEMSKAIDNNVQPAKPDAVSAALLPPLTIEMPQARKPLEERFSVNFSNVPASQFFMALVSGTRYSMMVHPEVTGTISANLKDVTIFEALDAIRELYGYDYKTEGSRIYIRPLTLQTRVFQVNYLTGTRKGTSDLHVTSSSLSDSQSSGNNSSSTQSNSSTTTTSGSSARTIDSSSITTSSSSDFWPELKAALETIVGNKEGRSIVLSPQSGIVVIRATWDEQQNVAAYLKAMQLSVDRQVILEAKILEVQLSDGFQSGINWAAFRTSGNSAISGGNLLPGTTLGTTGTLSTSTTSGASATSASSGLFSSTAGQNLLNTASSSAVGVGSLFGLAFQSSNFAALLSFLQTQGTVHVLSSPRIATLNNQKAVLKVGTDDFFVTNVSTTTTTGTTSTTSPSVTLQPFFSGVALDVTPQIDEDGNIILHVHPSVSSVTTSTKIVDLGTAGSLTLPLASSSVSETDSVVRGRDGQVVAIGGLMRQASTSDNSQVPGVGDVPVLGALFHNKNQSTQKRELVILIKPTIVQGSNSWTQDMLESQRRIQALEPPSAAEQK